MKSLPLAFAALALNACTSDGSPLGYHALRGAQDYRCTQARSYEEQKACQAQLPPANYEDYRQGTQTNSR